MVRLDCCTTIALIIFFGLRGSQLVGECFLNEVNSLIGRDELMQTMGKPLKQFVSTMQSCD
jgi:hypothetical protein